MLAIAKAVGSALKGILKIAPNAAQAATEAAVGVVSAPLVQVWSLSHGVGSQIVMNGAGQAIQLPSAAVSSASHITGNGVAGGVAGGASAQLSVATTSFSADPLQGLAVPPKTTGS